MKLGVLLKEYEIGSENIRFDPPTGRVKGFHRAAFIDAWQRYCPPPEKEAREPYKPYKPYKPYQDDVLPAVPRYGFLRPVRLEPYQDPPDDQTGTA
jgi:hypothetical protein